MAGPIASVGLSVAVVAALCFGVISPACYNAPKPDCGFVCGANGACPDDYTCASDLRCHRNGTPASLVCEVDAAVDAPHRDSGPGDAGVDADTTAPTVTAMSPTANQTNVAPSSVVTATFSEAVAGVSGTTFTLKNGATSVAGTVSYAAGTHIATFTPTAVLADSTLFTVALTSGITDAASNPLAPVTWHFTTADTTAPTVTSTTPANGDTNVAVGSTIVIVFSEVVINVDTTSFAVAGAGAIAGTIVASGGGTTYTFTPTASLPAGTLITVTLSSAITDTSSNALVPVTFSFMTA